MREEKGCLGRSLVDDKAWFRPDLDALRGTRSTWALPEGVVPGPRGRVAAMDLPTNDRFGHVAAGARVDMVSEVGERVVPA